MAICGIKDCDKDVISLGLCTKHLRRTKLFGSPMVVKSHSGLMSGLPAIERFNRQHKKGERPEDCWNWIAAVDADGYGRIRGIVGTVLHQKAHRFSWAYHTQSDIPPGMLVCHTCDNPRCVNPAHLWLGTAKDNVNDMDEKKRRNARIGEAAARTILTEKQVREILASTSPYTELAQKYGVAATTIGSIKIRKSWSHLDVDVIGHSKRVSPKRGRSDRINPEIVREIRSSSERGKDLASKFSVSVQLITAIRKRRAWAHVQ